MIILLLIFNLIILLFAFIITFSKNVLYNIVYMAGLSLTLAMVYYLLHSPDIAITEAAIGSAISTAIYILVLRTIKKK